jgi:REP element-mobilizing transposase RayT
MRKQKQLLLGDEFEVEKEFGGSHLKKSHAKKARPIAIKKTMHLTLRSSKAKGDKSFRYDKNRIQKIDNVVKTQAQKFGVEIYRFANVGNHIHMLVKASYRRGFISFLRAISGIIARIALNVQRGCAKTTRAERGHARLTEAARGFWDQRPWTRILFTWTEFKNVKKYVEQNFNEAMGFVPYKPRKYRSTA